MLSAFAGLVGRTRRFGGGDGVVAANPAIFGGPGVNPTGGR